MNFYEVLGIEENATAREIKRAYRSKAQKYHPDKSDKDNSEEFQKITQAYETLSDPKKRAAYDNSILYGDNPENYEKALEVLQQVFTRIYSIGYVSRFPDPLKEATASIMDKIANGNANNLDMKKEILKLNEKIGKIINKRKFESISDRAILIRIQALKTAINQNKETIEILETAIKILQDHESKFNFQPDLSYF